MKFLSRWLTTAIACAAAIWLVPGMGIVGSTSTIATVALLGLIMALIDSSIKPLIQFLSIPFSVLTLGLFYLVINTLMLYLGVWIAQGLFEVGIYIAGFGSAFLASIIISIVATIMNGIVGKD